jgi:phage terminase large subunit
LSVLEIQTAKVFRPLLEPSRYKGAHGGRGSGKSHFFAELLVEHCLMQQGTSAICIREVQKTLAQSSKRLVERKIEALGLGARFKISQEKIETPGGGLIIFQGMQDHPAESIKSLEDFRIAWVDEAQTLSARSLSLLRPTIRSAGSEIWASWNPRRKTDAIDEFLRAKKPDNAIVVQANWRDNPWWNRELEDERQLELARYPERYGHIYEGEYATAFAGAYFAPLLGAAKREGRIGKVAADPLLPLRAFIDIGGSGATADAFVIWICQFVGQEIRVLDYYEAVGQVLGEHLQWLRSKGYQKAIIHLPHDGVVANNITGKRYYQHFQEAEFDVPLPTPNQGRGADSLRIEAVRRILPKCWFNESTTEPGRDALGFYHERKDENRDVGLGPEHDWSSHAADAFGLMAILYEEPSRTRQFSRKIVYPNMGVV